MVVDELARGVPEGGFETLSTYALAGAIGGLLAYAWGMLLLHGLWMSVMPFLRLFRLEIVVLFVVVVEQVVI